MDEIIQSKFDNGEYFWLLNGFNANSISNNQYYKYLDCNEIKFKNCIECGNTSRYFWVKSEIAKLNKDEINEIRRMCEYKTYIFDIITNDMVNLIASIFDCNVRQITNMGITNIIEICNCLSLSRNKINEYCHLDYHIDSIKYKNTLDKYKIPTFEEYILLNYEI